MYVVGDKDNGDAISPSLMDEAKDDLGLLHAQCRGWFVQNQDPAAKIDGAGDCQRLLLSTGHYANQLVTVADATDPHCSDLVDHDRLRLFMVDLFEGTPTFRRFS